MVLSATIGTDPVATVTAGIGRTLIDKKQSQRTRHLHQVHHARLAAGGMGRDAANPRGGQLHQGPHHRARQAGQSRQGEARRLHPLLQAEHPARADRGQGQLAQRRRRHAAGPRIRRHPRHPVRVLVERRRLRVPRPHRRIRNARDDARPRCLSVTGRSVGALSRLEGADAGSRADRASGLLRGRQRQGPALLPGQRRQRRDRGHRQGPRPPPARHGDRHRQDLHRLPDHLAAVEGGPQEAHPVPRRPQRAHRSDDGQRLPPVRRGDGEALARVQDHRARGRQQNRSDAGARQAATDRHGLRDLSRPLSGDHRPGGAAEAVPRVLARLLRPDRDRRVPPRQRRRRFGVARNPRILLLGDADRPDRDAEGDQIRLQHRTTSASRSTPTR